ncbi:MAG TPA: hydrogenase [Casimicrobiaceae bacterium]|nr:hydrogenase [Casimicrobiaceae bacterium]
MKVAVASRDSQHPLIEQLFTRHGFESVNADNVDAFIQRPGVALLVFLEEPARIKETLDIAVIVPQLVRAFAGAFTVGVLLPAASRALHDRFGVLRYPALAVVRDGQRIGAVEGLRAWDDYLDELQRILSASPASAHTGASIATSTAIADGPDTP